MYKEKFDIKHEEKEKIINEAFDFESDVNNFKFPFHIMTKKYGRAFIEYCRAMWYVNETQDVDEFCKMNANMPIKFFENTIAR